MFTVIGEALLDLVQPTLDGPYVARPGGGPLNIAVGLRRLGHPTELMARLSRGPLGQVVRRHAEQNGVRLTHSVETDDPATLAFATLDQQGHASYEFYVQGTADWGWTAAELAALPADTRAVHCGSLAAAIAPGAEAILSAVQRVRAAGPTLVSFDPNVRPDLVGPRAWAVARVERFVAAAHVVKASDEDLAWLYPDTGALDVLAWWLRLGPALVVMTRGAAGCLAWTAHNVEVEAPGIEVQVEDTIGAGDAFMAGLLSGLADARHLTPAGVAGLTADDLRVALRQATVVSALTCERVGADPPTRAEYTRYVQTAAAR
jgi:fructokinase